MATLKLTKNEAKAVRFALRSDIEIIEHSDNPKWERDKKLLQSVLDKITRTIGEE